jgi:hypothetical protein
MGLEVVDLENDFVGKVVDTLPLDGGGEVQMLLVSVGRRFPRPRLVPAGGLKLRGRKVQVNAFRDAIEDAPSAEDRRWGNPADLARGYWITATP